MQPGQDEVQRFLAVLSRRALLKRSLTLGTVVTGAGFLPAACRGPGPSNADLKFLSDREYNTLEWFARVLLPDGYGRPGVVEMGFVRRLDELLAGVQAEDPAMAEDFKTLLLLIEYGPIFRGLSFRSFTRLSPEVQTEYIRGMERSRFNTLRLIVRNLRSLVMFFYFCDDRTWSGIRYAGPWLEGGQARLAAYKSGKTPL